MDKNKKSKTFNKMSIRKGISLSLAALTLAGPIVPYAVYANPTAAVQGTMKKLPAKAPAAYPTNTVNANNWNETEVKGDDYWPLGDLKPVKVGESDPVDMTDINYQGYFVDAEGRTNLRLVYMEASTVVSAVWKNLVIRVDSDLYSKIDWEKSYVVSTDGKDTVKFSQGTGSNEKQVNIYDLAKRVSSKKTNLPINLVLNEGLDITSLGNKNYVIQSRLTGSKNRLFAYAPGKTSLDYSSYTRQTSISLKDNITSEFLRGPGQSGALIAQQNQFMTEFIANPDKFDDTSETAVLRTMYGGLADANSSINTVDGKALKGKPIAYMQVFDARLIDYFKADANGVIADTTILEENKDPSKDAKSIPIKMENINYTKDGKLAYIVIGESNFSKEGVKVVTVDSLYDHVYDRVWYFTTIDYRIDKKKLSETFETKGQNKEIFSSMSGFVDSNPNGWSIFENSYDGNENFVVQEGESYIVDVSGISKKDQQGLMIQVGDTTQSLVRAMQGYYNDSKGGFNGIEKANEIAAGIYEFTLREGATIKPGESIRIYLPDNGDAQGPVNFMEIHNATKRNKGGATLKLRGDRNIDLHIYTEEDKGAKFELIYTPNGKTETTTVTFTKGGLWSNDDKNRIIKGIPNTAVLDTGGNFVLDTTKFEPGKDIIVKTTKKDGKELVSSFKYRNIQKSAEKYTKMAWVDHQDNSSIISIEKSLFVPYQEVYTNDYTDYGKDELYYNEKVDNNHYKNPTDNTVTNEEFMNNTEELLGFTKYQGGNIRMRYYQPDGKVYVGKATADASEYNDDGEVTKDAEKAVNIGGTEYKAYPYKMSLSTLSELRDAGTVEGGKLQLLKDMKLLLNASDGSSLPSNWYETRVKTRVLFEATEGQFEDTSKKAVKVVPDNVKYYQDEGYTANGFTGANVKENTGDTFPAAPTATGKTFLGWATKAGYEALGSKSVVTSAEYEKLTAEQKFTETTPITSHEVVYAIWSEEKLITFDANGGKFADGATTKTDNIADGVTAPDAPKQDGKTFLGWASTKDATAPEDGILDNVNEAKTVYAVWKDGVVEKTAAPTVEAPKAGDKEIKGTAPAGSDVTVKLPDGTEIKTKADQDGKWTATLPADKELAENDEIKVVAKDGDKEPSEEVKATVGAKTPEEKTAAPTVTAPKAGDKEIKGTGKAGAKVNITKENADGSGQGTEIARDVVVGNDGTWTANVPEGVTLAEGDIIYATQKEDGKTVSDQAEATVVAADTKVQAPTLKANDDGSVTVTPPTDKDVEVVQITYTDENNHEGTLAVTKDAKGQWKLPDGTDPSITIDPATGLVTIPANQVADGSEVKAVAQKGTEVSDEAKVKAKNNPVAKKEVTKWVQETADGRIILLKTEDGNKSDNDGVSDIEGYEFVRTDKTEDDTTITYTNVYKLLVGSKSVGLDGQELKAAALGYDKENPEEFTGYTFLFDEAGNTPSDVEGKKVYVVSRIYAKNPTVVEVADTNSLTLDEQKAVKAAVKAANPDLLDNQISVDNKGEVTIKRGNQTAKLASDLTVVKQGQTVAPTVEAPKAGDKEIKGTAPAGSDVTVKLPDGTEIKTKADQDGKWTATLPADKELAENDEIKVVAKDGDKEPSEEVKATVGAKTPEENKSTKPTIKPVKVGDKEITGTAGPNAIVNVTYPNGDVTETTADPNGNWSVDAPEGMTEGQTISATATEGGKAPSDAVEAKVKGNTPAVDDKTTIDDSKSKPVEPTNENQGTGIIVNNPQGSTITAEDEDGRYVPVSIDPITGEIRVYPESDVDGPIKVTITDKDGNVRVIYIDVIGHAMGRDDNRNGYVGDRDNYWFLPGIIRRHDRVETHPVYTVVPEKTTVGTPVHDTLWYVFHINEYEYEVVRNGVVTKRIMDVTPVIQNDRTMLPLRYVAEAIGADVQWDAKTRTATFTKNGLTASIQIDSDEIVLSNGKTIKMDSKPLNIKDRILVSVTNVANVFGMTNGNTIDGSDQDIEWNQNDKTATIYIRR